MAGSIVLPGLAASASASEFTNEDFLAWSKRDRDQWLEGAVLMAGHMVHLHDREKAQCVFDWYVRDTIEARKLIFLSMRKYPDMLPTTTLIALMRNVCGLQ